MTYVIKDSHWQNGSFSVRFSFSNGIAYCSGFGSESLVSNALGLKYMILLKHPIDKNFWTLKGMEEPLSQDEIHDVIEKRHKGSIAGEEYIFKVFDNTGKLLFGTRFDASEKIPPKGYGSEHFVVTSFSWTFPLPPDLQKLAKDALEKHEEKIRSFESS